MFRLAFTTIFISVVCIANGQLSKSTWLAGGMGAVSFQKDNYPGNLIVKTSKINLAPNIGYFFVEKFAAGIRLGYSYQSMVTPQTPPTSPTYFREQIFYGGPFARYYLLPAAKQLNCLVDGSYSYNTKRGGSIVNGPPGDISYTTYNSGKFGIAAGPVFYFNSTVGLETLISYTHETANSNFSPKTNAFQLFIGLQVHLEK